MYKFLRLFIFALKALFAKMGASGEARKLQGQNFTPTRGLALKNWTIVFLIFGLVEGVMSRGMMIIYS
jgi:hypothetical protein